MLKYYGVGERLMYFYNSLCKIEWENKYIFEFDMEIYGFILIWCNYFVISKNVFYLYDGIDLIIYIWNKWKIYLKFKYEL